MIGLAAGALAAGYVANGLAGGDGGRLIETLHSPGPPHIPACGTTD